MDFFQNIFQKILSILRVRSIAAGLEVSDEVVRFVSFNGKTWRLAAVRLEPGVFQKGKIQNEEAFVAALQALKAQIPGMKSKDKRIHVVVAPSSVSVYSQVFNLPIVEGKDLEKAVALNVQMLSPVDIAQMYSGADILKRDEQNVRLEMLAAFIEKNIVDDMTKALFRGGFVAVGIESRALALMRVLREKGSGIDIAKSYLFVDIDNAGMDFLIVRNGHLYFEYSTQWTDIANEKGEIAVDAFQNALASSLRQVMNFYGQHWPEPLSAVILSAAAFQDEAEKAITETLSVPVVRLSLFMGQPISSEWLIALGCSLRGYKTNARDKEINLLGEGAAETFHEDQLIHFANFWRTVVPIAMGLLVLVFFFADNFLANTRAELESQSIFNLPASQTKDINALEASSTAFNRSIALLQTIEKQQNPKYQIIAEVMKLGAAANVGITHITYSASPISVVGSAASEDAILAFKAAVEKDPNFGPANLPLSGIQANGNQFSFAMTFPLSGSAFK